MPSSKPTKPSGVSAPEPRKAQHYRHSLQPKSQAEILDKSTFRHTRSQNYGKRKSGSVLPGNKPPAPIAEVDSPDEDSVTIDIDVSNVKVSMGGASGANSNAGTHGARRKDSRGVENPAFVHDKPSGKLSRNNSTVGSMRSSVGNPSVQSLGIVKEQYCCCSRWTRCERSLFIMVAVLIFVIILLVITVALIAANKEGPGSPYDKIVNVFRKL